MDKQNVYSCNGILNRYKKEWNTDSCYNMEEFGKYYAKSKKPDTKSPIVSDSFYMKCPGQANL